MKKEATKKEDWVINERFADRHVAEAICKHGIGHHRGMHGCDGCCENVPKEIWEKTTKES
uniref:Uncharacterized protein n=1 Tax=viral metagenome TaxID=1070528 RepID=A0A6M3XRC9_9ZZZZ